MSQCCNLQVQWSFSLTSNHIFMFKICNLQVQWSFSLTSNYIFMSLSCNLQVQWSFSLTSNHIFMSQNCNLQVQWSFRLTSNHIFMSQSFNLQVQWSFNVTHNYIFRCSSIFRFCMLFSLRTAQSKQKLSLLAEFIADWWIEIIGIGACFFFVFFYETPNIRKIKRWIIGPRWMLNQKWQFLSLFCLLFLIIRTSNCQPRIVNCDSRINISFLLTTDLTLVLPGSSMTLVAKSTPTVPR